MNKKGEVKAIKKAASNDREQRVRPESTQKADGSSLNLNPSQGQDKQDFAKEMGAFGFEWARRVKGDESAFPTFDEMMKGILNWYMEQIRARLSGISPQQQIIIIKKANASFVALRNAIDITRIHEPMKIMDANW